MFGIQEWDVIWVFEQDGEREGFFDFLCGFRRRSRKPTTWKHILLPREDPFTDVSLNDFRVGAALKALDSAHLILDVFLVFEDIRLTSKHGWTWLIQRANVDDSQGSAWR